MLMPGIIPVRIESSPELCIVGLRRHYRFGGESGIEQQWWEFVPTIESIPNRVPDVTYGICLDFLPGAGFDYLSGVEVQGTADVIQGGVIQGMDSVLLPPKRYAVFAHEGHYSKLPGTFDAIINSWVPTVANADSTHPNFERYNKDFCPETGIGGIEIWFPLID